MMYYEAGVLVQSEVGGEHRVFPSDWISGNCNLLYRLAIWHGDCTNYIS